MFASLLFLAYTANAQDKNYKLEYPRYGFWSNWSIGGTVMYSWEYEHGGILDWREGGNIGVNLFLEKELNHVIAMRIVGETPGLFKRWSDLVLEQNAYDRNGNDYDRYGKFGVDFKFSFQGMCKGYDPDRRGNLYFFAGTGLSFSRDDVPLGFVGMYMQGGLGWSLKVCKHSTIFFEIADDICSDIANPLHQWHDNTGMVKFGYMYNFGPTQEDLDLIAQRALLTQENFDKMSSEIDGLRNDLRESKAREAKLVNRINELEANNNNVKPNSTTIKKESDNGVADSLRKVIEGYEKDKDNFYAMPFSILYDVDQYTVSEDQMGKVKAIADVMKNCDNNFQIVGYCDYSGSDEYNQKLSEKRAEQVKKLLVNRYGIDENRLTTSGKGKTIAFGDIKNAVNRRVSFYRN